MRGADIKSAAMRMSSATDLSVFDCTKRIEIHLAMLHAIASTRRDRTATIGPDTPGYNVRIDGEGLIVGVDIVDPPEPPR